MTEVLPEVTLLVDRRGERPANAVGAGDFWYEPEVWSLPDLSPAARVLYAGLCSFLQRGEINRHDLRNILKACTDEEISETLQELAGHELLVQVAGGFEVRPIKTASG